MQPPDICPTDKHVQHVGITAVEVVRIRPDHSGIVIIWSSNHCAHNSMETDASSAIERSIQNQALVKMFAHDREAVGK
jgi:hypothetical protein